MKKPAEPPETCPSAPSRRAIRNRLSRIEGQIGALKRAVGSGEATEGLLIQVAAVRGAMTKVAVEILQGHLIDCARASAGGRRAGTLEERITKALGTILKQS